MDSGTFEVPTTLPAGARFGAYEVVRVLGAGAFGTVYEALRHPLKKRVALKVLHADMARNPEAVTRVLREAEAASQLDHPHIVDVQDLGAIEGQSFLAMEFLEGEALDARLERVTRLSVEETLDLLLPILSAVSAVHARGIIHRDLKPANVFLSPGPQGDFPRLLDFGIAKDTTANSSLTLTAAVLGTPSYMSPEQVRESRLIDPRSDVWSLGVVLHECVTGRRPFDGTSLFETFEQIMRTPIAPPGATVPGVAPGFDAVVLRALSRDPAQRFASVRDLGAALIPFASPRAQAAWGREFVRSEPPSFSPARTLAEPAPEAAPDPADDPVVPTRSLRPLILGVGAVTAALLLIAAVVSFQHRPAPSTSRPPLVLHSTSTPTPPPAPAPAPAPAPVAAAPAPVVPEAPVPAPAPVARPAVHRPARPARPHAPATPPAGIGNY